MKLRDLRRAAEITQVELSEKLGIKQQTISQWENGKAMPRLDTVVKLSKILHCDILTLIKCFVDIE